MGQGDADTHYGLEHFGFDVVEMDSAIARLEGLGAVLADGLTHLISEIADQRTTIKESPPCSESTTFT